jgi:hypothetical protein
MTIIVHTDTRLGDETVDTARDGAADQDDHRRRAGAGGGRAYGVVETAPLPSWSHEDEDERMNRRPSIAFVVLGVGALVAATGGTDGASAEFPAFVLLAGCGLLFASRSGTVVLLALISILSAWNNWSQSSAGATAREVGSAALFILLIAIVMFGVLLDLVLNLVWRSTRSLPPGA